MTTTPQTHDTELSPLAQIHKYASELTARAKQLSEMEQRYEIMPGQSTQIMTEMIESYLYAALKTLVAQGHPQDKEAAREALKILRLGL